MTEKTKKKKGLTNTEKKLLKALADKANVTIRAKTSQKQIKKEAQKGRLSDAELKDLRTKYEDLTAVQPGKHRTTYAVRFKKGCLVSRGTKFKGIF